MTTHKRLPGLRLGAIALALLLLAAFAIGTQASALTIQSESETDAETGATPPAESGDRPQLPDGEMPQFDGQPPELPSGEMPQFDGQPPQLPSGEAPQFDGQRPQMPGGFPGGAQGEGGNGGLFIQQTPDAEDGSDAQGNLKQRAEGGFKSGRGFGIGQEAAGDSAAQESVAGGTQLTPAGWMLLGFCGALVLGGLGVGGAYLLRRRKAKTEIE